MTPGSGRFDVLSITHLVDAVLLFMLVEFAVLAWIRRGSGSMATVAIAVAPGACLLIAFRLSLAGVSWPWIAAALAVSLPFHLLDLRRRRP